MLHLNFSKTEHAYISVVYKADLSNVCVVGSGWFDNVAESAVDLAVILNFKKVTLY